MFYLALFLATRLVDVPRSLPLIHWLVLVFLLAGTRIAYVAWLTPQRAGRSGGPAPEWEPVLLLGAGQAAAILIDLFRPGASAAARLGVVGIIDDRTHYRGRAISGVPVLGQTAELGQIVARLAIHNMRPRRLVMTRSPDEFDPQSLQSLQEAALLHGILVQDAVELLRFGGEVERLATARPSLGTAQPAVRGSVWLVKRLIDIVAAAVLLVAASPAILATLLAVRVFLGSPMIFHQVRPGRHLAPFMLYKVRTLREGHLPDGRILDDELRQTRLGRFLRRSRLDELPQLWNVLIGQMSLVGPRPLLPRDLPELGEDVHERFTVRPGITGWAQVNGGHQLGMEEKLALDLWYVRNCSIALDLRIAIRTIQIMLSGDRIEEAAVREARRALQSA